MITIERGMNLNDGVSQKSPPGLVGLQNLGNTCYMNGALQALSNCPQLTRFLLDCPPHKKDKRLSHSYSELIKLIWDKPDTHYTAPTSIIRIIKCIYPDFRGCTQQDTQEFLRCFLEQLHLELKEDQAAENETELMSHHPIPTSSTFEEKEKVDDNRVKDEALQDEDVSDDLADKQNININKDDNVNRQAFIHKNNLTTTSANSSPKDDDKGENINRVNKPSKESSSRSIISDIFEFKISSSVVCSSCNNTSTTIESFKDLSIPIPSRDHPFYSDYGSDEYNGRRKFHQRNPSISSYASSKALSERSKSNTFSSENLEISTTKESVISYEEQVTSTTTSTPKTTTSNNHQQIQQFSDPAFIIYRWLWDWLSYFKQWFWAPSVALDDCLSIFFGTDPLEGDNEYSCDVCNKKNKGVKYLKILELPEILCIHFKRYESISSSKITTHVSFPIENLDLASYMCEEAPSQCTTYSLISCICHHGSALLTGHYTTYALNCFDGQWYEFDDEYVTNVDQSQVENSEAYILFYQKSKSSGSKMFNKNNIHTMNNS